MRFLIPVALAAFLTGPAWAQLRLENEPPPPTPPPYQYATPEQLAEARGPDLGQCPSKGGKATKPFAENINAASSAFAAKDYVAALNAMERARPHASDIFQRTALAQIEVASMLQLGGEIAAIPKLEVLVDDPCIGAATREGFRKSLEQARAKAAAQPH